MGKLFYMHQHVSRSAAAKSSDIEVVQAQYSSLLENLQALVGLVDRMAAKVALLEGLYPIESLRTRLGTRRLQLLKEMSKVRSTLASLSTCHQIPENNPND